jgi:hypothetical protein
MFPNKDELKKDEVYAVVDSEKDLRMSLNELIYKIE